MTILSILPVQSELGALEVAAQAALVRVLTHEIMNSLTTFRRFPGPARGMVASAEQKGADLGDANMKGALLAASQSAHGCGVDPAILIMAQMDGVEIEKSIASSRETLKAWRSPAKRMAVVP